MIRIANLRTTLHTSLLMAGLSLAAAVSPPATAHAQQSTLNIAAVVNDDIVTIYDVNMRMRIALHSSQQPATKANQRRLLPQVVRALIDEKLKTQQAKSMGVLLSNQELSTAVQKLERANGMPAGGMRQLAAALQIPYDMIIEQVRVGSLWSKAISRKYSRKTRVTDAEAADRLQELQSNLGKPEHLVSEIYLPYDIAKTPQEVQGLAQNLAEQLRKGAPFNVAAQQFSRSPTANRGGSLGWVPQGQLEPEVDQALAQMQQGQISNPIPTQSGYYVLKLNKRRVLSAPDKSKTKLRLSQIKLPLVGEKALSTEDQGKVIQYIQSSLRDCKAFDDYGKTLGTQDSGPLGSMLFKDIPTNLQSTIANLKVGQPSQVTTLGGVPTVLMVCERIVPSVLPSLEEIKHRIQIQRLERTAQRLLSTLRREAVIDVRI